MSVISIKPPLPGFCYRPSLPGNYPGILFLHGSEGGHGTFYEGENDPSGENSIVVSIARRMASLGFVTYALSYFDARKLEGFSEYPPDELVEVDLAQYTGRALEWLRETTAPNKVGIWGGSRGAEQALLLATYLKTPPDAVVAAAPADMVFAAFTKEMALAFANGSELTMSDKSAWLFDGEPLGWGQDIEVEKYPGSLYFDFGSRDDIWGPGIDPSRLADRLDSVQLGCERIQVSSDSPFESLLKEIRSKSVQRMSVEFLDEGHFIRNKPTHEFREKLTQWFFATHLK